MGALGEGPWWESHQLEFNMVVCHLTSTVLIYMEHFFDIWSMTIQFQTVYVLVDLEGPTDDGMYA